ncbi:hypothetical protein YC2023_117049 [Brassica napus]
MSAMYVVDSNSACPSTVDVTSYLTPISTMLPHLISSYCIVPNPGFSGVAALILLEMAAADQPLNTLSLIEEEVRVAVENYAIAALIVMRNILADFTSVVLINQPNGTTYRE